MSTIRLHVCLLGLLCAGAVLAALPLHAAPATPLLAEADQPDNERALDALLANLHDRACASSAELCGELKAFAAGARPCFPSGDRLAVGHAYLIADDGKVSPAQYFVVHTVRTGDTTLIQTQHVYAENADEVRAAEDLIQALASDAVDQNNALYRYIRSRAASIPQLLAEDEARSAVVRTQGPPLYLRQAGENLYVVVPGATLTQPGQRAPLEGMTFSVIPHPGRCP